jgi:hypothetical protein
VVARALLAAHIAIDTGILQAIDQRGTEQDMVDAQTGIPPPPIALIIPEGVDRPIRMSSTDGIDPVLVQQSAERGTTCRLDQGILGPDFVG